MARTIECLGIVIAAATCCCSSASVQPSETSAISVVQLEANKAAYVGVRVTVEGRVYVQTVSGLHPCVHGQPCPKYDDALLALADPAAPVVPPDNELVRLYRRPNPTAAAEQIHCAIVNESVPTFDCGSFTPGSVATVTGVFTREQVPYQTVVGPDGHANVIKYQDAYYLLLDVRQ